LKPTISGTPQLPRHRDASLGAAAVEIERLFAEYRLAGVRRGLDEIGMRVGRTGNYDCFDGGVGEGLRLGPDCGAVSRGELLRGDAVGIDDDPQPRTRMGGDVSGMDRPDAACAELTEIHHS
jgi:hypothetical protein